MGTLERLERFSSAMTREWDAFVDRANNGTVFHKLDFLSYHGERFRRNEHHLLWRKGDEIFAVLPLGLFEVDGRLVARSPFGASWGGLVASDKMRLRHAFQIVSGLITHLNELDVDACEITVPPSYCYRRYTNFFEFALLAHGFLSRRRDITYVLEVLPGKSAIDHFDGTRRTQVRKARKVGVSIERDAAPEDMYALALENKQRLGGRMTHTLDEVRAICRRNPTYLKVDVARIGETVVASNMYINNPTGLISFYPSHLKAAAHTSALSLLISDAVQWSLENDKRWLDFGCSSEFMKVRHMDLPRFKESFGSTGLFRETYSWARPQAPAEGDRGPWNPSA